MFAFLRGCLVCGLHISKLHFALVTSKALFSRVLTVHLSGLGSIWLSAQPNWANLGTQYFFHVIFWGGFSPKHHFIKELHLQNWSYYSKISKITLCFSPSRQWTFCPTSDNFHSDEYVEWIRVSRAFIDPSI